MKSIIKNLVIVTLPSILFIILAFELVFRTAIPACQAPYYRTDEYGMLNYDPSIDNKGLFTIGRFAEQRARWKINNYGWNSRTEFI